MARKRLDYDEAFKNIIGEKPETSSTEPEIKDPEVKKVETNERSEDKEKLVQTAFYITPKHRRALKIKAATDGTPQNKDQSAIVRAALDMYLAETLKTI